MSKRVNQFKVVAVTNEHLEMIQIAPECFDSGEGSKTILITTTADEIPDKLPSVLKDIPEPKDQYHLLVVAMSGECERCEKNDEVCTHMSATVFGQKQIVGVIDLSKIPEPTPC